MVEPIRTQDPVALDFEDAPKASNPAADARRDPAKVTVAASGHSSTNSEGKDAFGSFIKRLGGDPNSYQLTYRANEGAGKVALYPAQTGDTGIMNVTIYSNSISFHLGSCFKHYPLLRPSFKVDCHFQESTDAKGRPCIIVDVAAGTATRAVKRKKKGDKKPGNQPPGDSPENQDTQETEDTRTA
jgi:hypothetical protein